MLAPRTYTIGGIPNRVSDPGKELPGARLEVETRNGPGGSPLGMSVTVEQLQAYLSAAAATNAAPSLAKSVEFRTKAERATFGPDHALSTTMEELLPLSLALGTTIFVTNDPDEVHVYRVQYDGDASPAMQVWADGDFAASQVGTIGGKIMPVLAASAPARRPAVPFTNKALVEVPYVGDYPPVSQVFDANGYALGCQTRILPADKILEFQFAEPSTGIILF
jgi:hypothetical protein